MSSINDPISDFLTRIRNAAHAKKDEVSIPNSKLKVRLAEILKEEGYIDDVTIVPDRLQGLLVVKLRYDEDGVSVIRGMRRQSRPGRRVYLGSQALPKVRNGLGTAILSTSQGLMTDQKARAAKVGGEYICSIW
jgi:small subunit ribosomal protein S8